MGDDADLFTLSMGAWDEAGMKDDDARFLPGLKRLMNRVVPWLVGDITKPDVQGRGCGSGEDIQAAACGTWGCACGAYMYPTLEAPPEPIVDDDGIHQPDRCLFGVGDPSIQEDEMRPVGSAKVTFTVSEDEAELLLDGLCTMVNDCVGPVGEAGRQWTADVEALLERLRTSLHDLDKPHLSSQTLCGHDWQPWSYGVLHCAVCGGLRADLANRATEERT